jgi:hypothetical protein
VFIPSYISSADGFVNLVGPEGEGVRFGFLDLVSFEACMVALFQASFLIAGRIDPLTGRK